MQIAIGAGQDPSVHFKSLYRLECLKVQRPKVSALLCMASLTLLYLHSLMNTASLFLPKGPGRRFMRWFHAPLNGAFSRLF